MELKLRAAWAAHIKGYLSLKYKHVTLTWTVNLIKHVNTNKSGVNSLLSLQPAPCLLYHLMGSGGQSECQETGITDSPNKSLFWRKAMWTWGLRLWVVLTNIQLSEFLQVLQVPKAIATQLRRAAKAVITHLYATPIWSFIFLTAINGCCLPCARHCIGFWILK